MAAAEGGPCRCVHICQNAFRLTGFYPHLSHEQRLHHRLLASEHSAGQTSAKRPAEGELPRADQDVGGDYAGGDYEGYASDGSQTSDGGGVFDFSALEANALDTVAALQSPSDADLTASQEVFPPQPVSLLGPPVGGFGHAQRVENGIRRSLDKAAAVTLVRGGTDTKLAYVTDLLALKFEAGLGCNQTVQVQRAP